MNEVQPIKNKRDIERMKKALHGRDKLLFIIGINSSLRISDLLSLKVGDVQGDYITLRERKTGKAKRVKVNAAIRKAVRELTPADAKATDWLFPSRKGDKPITRVHAWRVLAAAAKRAGLATAIGTHSLRKTFAYHAYKNGTDLALLMRVLNHASQRETLRYIGVEQDDIDDVYVDVCL